MMIIHESDLGGEYHVRVKLSDSDIQGIAINMQACAENVDGRMVAQFLRRIASQALEPTAPTPTIRYI